MAGRGPGASAADGGAGAGGQGQNRIIPYGARFAGGDGSAGHILRKIRRPAGTTKMVGPVHVDLLWVVWVLKKTGFCGLCRFSNIVRKVYQIETSLSILCLKNQISSLKASNAYIIFF